jgi:hypothetical protein
MNDFNDNHQIATLISLNAINYIYIYIYIYI